MQKKKTQTTAEDKLTLGGVAQGLDLRCGADILEFRGMGRHEGPKALISERTPRQTERGGAARKERMEEREEKTENC